VKESLDLPRGGGAEPPQPHTVPLSPAAVQQHYRSVDSAPREFAVNRPASAANGALVAFVALSLVLMTAVTVVVNSVSSAYSRDLILASADGEQAAVPLRLFMITFFLVFACFLQTNWWRRSAVAAELVGGFLVITAVVDLGSAAVDGWLGITTPVVGQQVFSALTGMVLFPVTVFRHAHLPAPAKLSHRGRVRWHAWLRLAVPMLFAFAVAAGVEHLIPDLVEWMRTYALLGGIGPGIFLVQQVFAVTTALIGLVMVTRSRRHDFAPPLAVLVPAHNEAHDISVTIAAVDLAAGRYGGPVHLYVVDNVSTDQTVEVTTEAIAECSHLTGTVLRCAQPGKAIALNYGLSQVREDFVVRIDADTTIGGDCLHRALRHFADPGVGAVGGLPLPPTNQGFFNRVRLIEVLIRHGFFQVSLMGYDGIVGQPGMFTAYRRAAFEEAGPLVQGMNGEDTDICLRFSSAGYRSLADPTVVYCSEVPRTWAHLREQRTRWFRSIYHVAAHNRHALFNRHTMAGSIVVPWQLFNAAHRAMLLPILIFGILALSVFGGTFPGLHAAPLLATFLGLPMLVAIGVCLGLGHPRALLNVPEYLVFRLIRSYYTLAAVLSLVYPPLHPGGLGRLHPARTLVRRTVASPGRRGRRRTG